MTGGSLPGYPAANASDGNPGSYWEGPDGAGYPQDLTADLGSVRSVGTVVLSLPAGWTARSQALTVLGSAGGAYSVLAGPAVYGFTPAAGNAVAISLPAGTRERYLRLSFTGNTGWPAAQVGEFQVFAGTNLALGKPATATDAQPGYPAAS
jgi:hypothetical protein